jgi:hypothetical protein
VSRPNEELSHEQPIIVYFGIQRLSENTGELLLKRIPLLLKWHQEFIPTRRGKASQFRIVFISGKSQPVDSPFNMAEKSIMH